MSKKMGTWCIIAVICVLVGLICFVGARIMANGDFTKLSTVKYETNEYAVNEDFSAVSINTDTADICFIPAVDGKCKVVCMEMKNAKHNVGVQDEKLTINVDEQRKWYEYIGITISSPKIKVYLPNEKYE